ncbi:glycoside hydrolase family 75 protein [Myriangium duriaei CBS 260.36]|uniref:Endo-chitosanase n=1 Tax=Myriangium duriaei CBS 260.36 TaxID=1168546 RepID=A0A9P4ML77_9PEZI|nr:glycoside hydrolase family 75 protein [Myriangium duriaei CBS 260.36]
MKATASVLALASAITGVIGQNALSNFYNSVLPGPCTDILATGFHDSDTPDTAEWSYCQQSVKGKAIFLKGNGKFANMDIDCDGDQTGGGAGTRCGASQDTQSETAFKDTVANYGIPDLNANIHPFVVFGNYGNYKPTFDPQQYGIKPLSVMAVVCGNKIVYGVWGDTNGDDGPPVVGEASLALGTLCYGDSVNGNAGHDETDVLYIAFVGDDAVPGRNGAAWTAKSADEFEASIKTLGDSLVARLVGGGSATPTTFSTSVTSGAPAPTSTGGAGGGDCSWTGHCAGASCSTDDDCSDVLTCQSGKCGSS